MDQNYERYESAEAASDDIDLKELSQIFWRRKMVILSVLLGGISLAVIFIATIAPRYSAQAFLLFESDSKKIAPQDYLLPFSINTYDFSFLITELEILKSRSLAEQVIQKLHSLPADQEQSIAPLSDEEVRKGGVGTDSYMSFKTGAASSSAPAFGAPIDKATARAISNFIESMKVSIVPGSTVVSVHYTSHDPYQSALIANTIVDTYREFKLAEKYKIRSELTAWLDQRLSEVRAQVFEIETQIEKFKTANNLNIGRKTLVSTEKINELNEQLLEAQTLYRDLETQLERFNNRSNNDDFNAGQNSRIIDLSVVRDVQEEKRLLETELSQLSNRYGPKHPEIVSRRTKLLELDKALDREIKLARAALQSEMKVARAGIDNIHEEIEQSSVQSQHDREALIKLREMEREAEASNEVLNTLLNTYKKAAGQSDTLDSVGVDVLSYASVPFKASYPNKPLLLSLAAFTSLVLGLVIALLLEKLDTVFRRPQQLEKAFAVPCLAAIPPLKNVDESDVAGYILSNPSSAVAEAVRTLRISLSLESKKEGQKCRVILVTSSCKDEGKTALSLWLGRLSAKSGERVLLIDSNLRNPKVHKLLGQANDTSLVDFLSGQKKLEETVKKDGASGMDYICGQAVPNSAFDLISTKQLETLTEALRQKYDLVILNAPPSYEMPDAKAIYKLVDQAVYVVAAHKTAREYVYEGAKYFIEKGKSGFGFVMTNHG